MGRLITGGLLAAAVALTACGSADRSAPASTATTTTTAAATAVPPDMEALAASLSDGRLDGATAEVNGDTVQISTGLYRDGESGPAGLGICIGAQEFGAQGEIQVLGSDGGVIASTRNEVCGIRVD